MPLGCFETPSPGLSALIKGSCATWFYAQALVAHRRLRVSARQGKRLSPGEGQEIVQDLSARLVGETVPSIRALRRTGLQPKNKSRRKIGPEVELELTTILGKQIADLPWEDLRNEMYSTIGRKKAMHSDSNLWGSP